jgi:predicted component of type VI protein secretion system
MKHFLALVLALGVVSAAACKSSSSTAEVKDTVRIDVTGMT